MKGRKNQKPLWKPSKEFKNASNLQHYLQWLSEEYQLNFKDYQSIWQWSIDHPENFWESIWKYFKIKAHRPYKTVISDDPMPKTTWFDGAYLNYAEHIFRHQNDDYPAIVYKGESTEIKQISWQGLRKNVAAFRHFLQKTGIKKGDRVVAFLPNIPEASIAFLAANSLGAIWSSTSPDFGVNAVTDRFHQIEPKVLIAAEGYVYNGKYHDKSQAIQEIAQQLPTLERIVILENVNSRRSGSNLTKTISWEEAISDAPKDLEFEPVPFSHPIWVLFSSGTTGLPKPITHSHGGVLLEHLKYLAFHHDVKPGDLCFWYTTTGWMMWNYIQACWLLGGTLLIYDGSPTYPTLDVLWEFAEETKMNHFGTSAGFIIVNMKRSVNPGKKFNLTSLRSIGSTGSPLPAEGFEWVYKNIHPDIWLTSISGGTDVCSAFVGGNPLRPVYAGEIQCRALGCALAAYNAKGQAVENEVGEMVITKPMPSMPIYFWNDDNFERYKLSYFDMFPNVWRHGDWIKTTDRQSVIIYGRSDSTLNRGGVRIGTSEIYRALNHIPAIEDSLIISLEKSSGSHYMPLFVKMAPGEMLNDSLKNKIRTTLRNECSPRHVPDDILEIPEVPYTISGKKIETPVKSILMGENPKKVINPGALKNPSALEFFVRLQKK